MGREMQKLKSCLFRFKTELHSLLVLVIGASLVVVNRRVVADTLSVNLNFVPPPRHLELFSFGYRENLADILWIRLIQDMHVCEKAKDGVAFSELARKDAGREKCRKGWVYQMLDSITDLAPRFELPYSAGALHLSILVDDAEGAANIFEKGLGRFPGNYKLSYAAAYHYLMEMNQPHKAAELLVLSAKNGGPAWMYALAGKLLSESGRLDLAIQVLEDGAKTAKTAWSSERIHARLEEVKRKKRAAVEASSVEN